MDIAQLANLGGTGAAIVVIWWMWRSAQDERMKYFEAFKELEADVVGVGVAGHDLHRLLRRVEERVLRPDEVAAGRQAVDDEGAVGREGHVGARHAVVGVDVRPRRAVRREQAHVPVLPAGGD